MKLNELPSELQLLIVSFLRLRESSSRACVSKGFHNIAVRAHLCDHTIGTARLREEVARPFSFILDILRFACLNMGLVSGISGAAKKIVGSPSDMHLLRASHLYDDLLKCNTAMYTHWDCDYSGQSGAYSYLLQSAEMNRGQPDTSWIEFVDEARFWKANRIHDCFYVYKERSDGTVVISQDITRVYLVQGIRDSLAEIFIRNGRSLPVQGHTTLLPFQHKLVYDGLFCGTFTDVSKDTLKKLHGAYENAVDRRAVIHTLDGRMIPPSQSTSISASNPLQKVELSPRHREALVNSRRAPEGDSTGIWVFRRCGYSEASNPNHLVVVLGGSMHIAGPVPMKALEPTAQEIIDIVVDVVVKGKGMIPRGYCPR